MFRKDEICILLLNMIMPYLVWWKWFEESVALQNRKCFAFIESC